MALFAIVCLVQQLGIGKSSTDGVVSSCSAVQIPTTRLDAGERAEEVAVGKNHSLVLSSKGRVFSFGSGLYHALGHGSTDNVWSPKLVSDS